MRGSDSQEKFDSRVDLHFATSNQITSQLSKGTTMKSTSMKALLLSAAMTGLLAGANASTTPVNNSNGQTSVKASTGAASVLLARAGDDKKDKHSCAGKNDCKGKGGCKSSDNGCKGKNSCKGKGGCATDGSKMPQAV
jgi:hypothetical protein